MPSNSQVRILIDTLDLPYYEFGRLKRLLAKLNLTEWSPPLAGPYCSLYFSAPGSSASPFNIRARIYKVSPSNLTQSDLALDLNTTTVLEIKRKKGNHDQNPRKEIKYRQTMGLREAIDLVNSLGTTKQIWRRNKMRNIPPLYPTTTIPAYILRKIASTGILFKPSFTIHSFRHHWIVNPGDQDKLRITIDKDYFYHYISAKKDGILHIKNYGMYPHIRVEIKLVDKNYTNKATEIRDKILSIGGFRPHFRGDAKSLYRKIFYNELSNKLPAITEFHDELDINGASYEMESKITIIKPENPYILLLKLKKYIERGGKRWNNEYKPYSYTYKRRNINEENNTKSSETGYHVYGFYKDFKLTQAFFISLNQNRPNWVGVKRKSNETKEQHENTLLRKEEKIDTAYKEFTSKTLESILDDEAANLNIDKKELKFLGSFKRSKYSTPLISKTGRCYILSVDRCMCKKNTLQQIEIEYCGNLSTGCIPPSISIKQIDQEIADITDSIYKILEFWKIKSEINSLTKFQWVSNIN